MVSVALPHGSGCPLAARLAAPVSLCALLILQPIYGQAQENPQEALETRVFGDWQQSCTADGTCRLTQANVDSETEDIRMRTEFSRVAENQILMRVIVPNSILLVDGPWLTIDGVYVGKLNYVRCSSGCEATIIFSNTQIRQVVGGNRGVITVTAGGQRVGIVISLDGLADGIIFVRN